jgi:Protein of unknown function (DUF2934)
MEGSAET